MATYPERLPPAEKCTYAGLIQVQIKDGLDFAWLLTSDGDLSSIQWWLEKFMVVVKYV